MRKMASKYSSDDATTTTIRVIDDLHWQLVLLVTYEDPFVQEDREIKRGTNTATRQREERWTSWPRRAA